MLGTRLKLALDGGLSLPESGTIAVFEPPVDADLSALPKERVEVISRFYPDHQVFKARGYKVSTAPSVGYAAAVVCLPRSKPLGRLLVAWGRHLLADKGPVIVDGQKEDGVDSMLKACRERVLIDAPVNKAHGKLFVIEDGDFVDWWVDPGKTADGWETQPGVFSADGVDRASALLAAELSSLKGHGTDLGAGWGYLSAMALKQNEGIKALHLVEADYPALDSAEQNIDDERAQFHWNNALTWRPDRMLDFVIMNPPFHQGRKQDPELGRAFIRAAAGMLAPRGILLMVANAHLGYENVLDENFGEVSRIGGDRSFKLFRAERPSRQSPRGGLGSGTGRQGR